MEGCKFGLTHFYPPHPPERIEIDVKSVVVVVDVVVAIVVAVVVALVVVSITDIYNVWTCIGFGKYISPVMRLVRVRFHL